MKDTTKRKWPTWVFVLAGLLVLGGAVAVPVVARLTSGDGTDYLADAERYMEAGDVRAALIQYRNAVREEPENGEARFALGIAYLEAGDPRSAEAELARARSMGIDPERIAVPLAESLLRQGRFQEVLDTVAAGERETALEARAMSARGFALLGLRRLDEAEAALLRAQSLVPGAEMLVGLAQLNAEQGDLDDAESFADQALELDADNVAAIALKGDVRRRLGDPEAARELFDRAIEISPTNVPARLARASMLLAEGETARASGDVEVVLDRAPAHPLANYLSALSLARNGADLEALVALQRVEGFILTYPPGLYLRSVLHLRQNQLEQAESSLTRLLELESESVATKKLLGMTYLRKGQPERAVALLEPVAEMMPHDTEILAILANAHLESGDSEAATRLAEQLISDNPGNEALQAQLGTQIAVRDLRSGRVDEALEKLEDILRVDPASTQAGMLVVLTYLRQGRVEEAVEIVAEMKARMGGEPLPHHLMGRIEIRNGDMVAARAEFDAALERDPEFLPAILNLALLDVAAEDFPKATERFRTVLELDSTNLPAMMALSGLAFRDGRTEEAVALLDRAIEADPTAIEPRLRLVNHHLQSGDAPRAVTIARDAAERISGPRQVQALELLGRAEMTAGQHSNAANTFRRIVGMLPSSIPAHRLLAQAQLAADNATAARRTLQEAVAKAPDNPDPRIDLVRLELQTGDLEAAMQAAAALREAMPDASIGDTLVGDVLMEAEFPAEAAEAYRVGLEKEPTSALVVRIFRAETMAGDKAGAMDTLRRWLDANEGDTVVRFALASELLTDGEMGPARREFEALLAEVPDNPVVLNNLAWLAAREDDPVAFGYAERAFALAPGSPEIKDTFAWLLLQRDEVERAAELLAEAYAALPNNPEVKYHYAVALQRSGEPERAQALLREIVEDGLDASITSQAREFLASLER